MFDVRDLSNGAIVVLLIALCAVGLTVRALATPVIKPTSNGITKSEIDHIDPNMAFYLLPQQDLDVKVGDIFAITVVVENATNMFGWQVCLTFDPAKLECVEVSLPSQHVLSSYKHTICGVLAEYNHSEFGGGPLQSIRNDKGWVLAGDCLLGADQPTFNGSGNLCQIEFKATASGFSTLRLLNDSAHDFYTFNLSFDIEAITSSSVASLNVYAQRASLSLK
jgi:hypothetical protein